MATVQNKVSVSAIAITMALTVKIVDFKYKF